MEPHLEPPYLIVKPGMTEDPFKGELRLERKAVTGYASQTLSSGKLESTVVPGFWIEMGWLWHVDLPSSMGCLREILAE